MKMQRFSVPITVSLLLGGFFFLNPVQQTAQAQQGRAEGVPPAFSDFGGGTFDGATFAPGRTTPTRVETIVPAIPFDRTNEYVAIVINNLDELPRRNLFDLLEENLEIPGNIENEEREFQTNLAIVLINPTDEASNFVISRLTDAGIAENNATQLVQELEGMFQDIQELNNEQIRKVQQEGPEALEVDYRDNLELRARQARELIRAVDSFNQLIENLDSEVLNQPPNSLLTIRSVLFEASEATKLIEEQENEFQNNEDQDTSPINN